MAATPVEVVVDFFKQQEWNYELDEENQRVRSGYEGECGEVVFFVSASEEKKLCFVLSVFPIKCPVNRRKPCAELLARLNYGMVVGCFELDFESGRIHFKTSAPFSENGLEPEVLRTLVGLNLSTMERSIPGILSLLFGRVSPKQAAARIQAAAEAEKKEKAKTARRGAPDRFSRN